MKTFLNLTSLRLHSPCILLALAAFLAVPSHAQTKDQPKALATATANAAPKADAGQIPLEVIVRDKKGNVVPDLTKSDFTLMLDHKPQPIESVSSAAGLPTTVGLLIDTSAGQSGALTDERASAGRFLDQVLATSGQRAFVVQFAREVDLLADVSPNKTALHSALEQLGSTQSHNTTTDQDNSGERRLHTGGGDTFYDALYLASDQVMKPLPARKVLVVVTGGIDSGSKESLFSAIEAAQRANTIVYTLYVKGEGQRNNNNNGFPRQRRGGGWPGGGGGGYPGGGGGYPGGGGGWPGGGNGGNRQPNGRPTEGSKTDGRKILEQICSETGGHMFEIGKKMSYDQAFTNIATDLKSQYLVAFTPGTNDRTSGFHRVALTVDKKGAFVLTRPGYYAGDE
jgi:hypothetical protein